MSVIQGDMDQSVGYTIESLPGGGYVVIGPASEDWAFASTTLDEALRYVRTKLLPEPEPAQVSDPEVDSAQYRYDTMFKTLDLVERPSGIIKAQPNVQSAWQSHK